MKRLTSYTSLLAITIGVLVLIGWVFDIIWLREPVPGIISMKFNTALCFILAGIILLVIEKKSNHRSGRVIVYAGSALIFFFSFLAFLQYILDTNIGIDEWLWKEEPGATATIYPGRMSLVTAVNFIMLSFIFAGLANKKLHWFIQALLFFISLIAILTLANYSFGQSFLSAFPQVNTMAITTAFLFIILSCGVFFSRPLRYTKFSFNKKIAAFFTLVVLILGLLLFAFSQNTSQSKNSTAQVEHTLEVLLTAEKANTHANSIQGSARGFILTGDEIYAQQYERSVADALATLKRLDSLVEDNPGQITRVANVQNLLDDYIRTRNELIRIRKAKGFQKAQELFNRGDGLVQFRRIQAGLEDIKTAENQLLTLRKESSQNNLRSSTRIALFFQGIILLILVIALFVIYSNTRARDKAESALRKSEEFVRAIINNTTNPITIRDMHGNYLLVNKPVAELLKRDIRDIVGKSSYEFLSADMAEQAKRADEVCAKSKAVVHAEISMNLADGLHHFSVNRFPLFNEQNEVYAVGTVSTDITSIKKAEEQIRELNTSLELKVEEKTKEVIERERQYRFLIENMREGIQIIGTDWKYVFVNDSLVRQSKYPKEQLLGRTILESYPGVEETELFATLEKCMYARIPQVMESEFVFPDGSRDWFELSIQPVPEGIFILSMDITARKKVEQELMRYAEELRSSNIELERFAYVASHDLQEPLRMVSSFLNLLEVEYADKLDDNARRYINFAVDGSGRMKLLVNDLLQYSRIGTNKAEFSPVNLDETISYVKRVFEEEIKASNATMQIAPLPVIIGNKSLIGQLFMNLVGNAIKYRGDKPLRIDIGYTEEKDKFIFYVKDNGIGIDPKFFDKIFIIFQRLHSKKEFSGTGIGLAICKKIVDVHKGKIWVESKEGEGSTFYFSIPK